MATGDQPTQNPSELAPWLLLAVATLCDVLGHSDSTSRSAPGFTHELASGQEYRAEEQQVLE
jgi:hypothetical protein